MTIAGHLFTDGPMGRACGCGMLWTQIAGATKDDVGRLGIAHTGALNEAELAEIVAERERIWRAVAETCG